MKYKSLVIVLLISLLILPIFDNPIAYDDSLSIVPEANVFENLTNETQIEPFALAGDGDISDESITSFSETLPDDEWYYPDHEANWIYYANTGQYFAGQSGTHSYDSYLNLSSINGGVNLDTTGEWYVTASRGAGAGGLDYYAIAEANYSVSPRISTANYYLDVNYALTDGASTVTTFQSGGIQAWDWTTSLWDMIYTEADFHAGSYPSDKNPVNRSVALDDDYFQPISNNVSIRFFVNGSCGGYESVRVTIDYGVILANQTHIYGESFADVSDWTLIADGTTLTTDSDVASIKAGNSGGDDWDVAYTNTPDLSGSSVYFELRYKMNTTDIHYVRVYSYTGDYGVGDIILQKALTLTTSWKTLKWISTSTNIGSIHFTIRTSVAKAGPVDFQVDYLQIGPADEMGLQHDFSTTTGISSSDGGTISSDGDKVTLTADADGATFIIVADTTATAAKISTTYYPLLHLEITGGSSTWTLEQYDGSAYATLQSATTLTTGAKRFNMKALDTYVEKWKITLSNSGTLISDFLQAYSIANFTVTQSGVNTDDYFYVDSGTLYSHVDTGYIEANYDPVLSVSDTYSVYNLTTGGTSPEFSQYVSSWSTYSDETRGATTSGTVTDIKLKFSSTEIISAIKFIEDSTSPTVVRSSSTPNDPEDDETVTLSAVITDAVEVYKVYFDAIVYPAGFSDTAYYATEQSDNLWTYSFTTLQNGYYCFKVQATDGANTNSLTEFAYIELTVREAAIIVEEITLIGAGEDFTMMSFSARINRDCSYTIYEESTTSAETDTYSGSVTSPSFNLAWEKLDVDDSNVNFTIKFVSGALTYNYTSQYQVAQTTFYVEHYNHNGPDWSEYVTVTGRITKYASYTVYIDDVEATTGTITNLDFDIEFSKILTSANREAWHDWAIKFTNGSQTCWANGTLYLWKNDPDQAEIGGGDLGRDERLTIQMWTTIGAIIGFIGVVSIGLTYFKLDEMKQLQLPNYQTQSSTREERRRQRQGSK